MGFLLTALEGLATADFQVGRKLIVFHDGPPRNPDLAAAVDRPDNLHDDLHFCLVELVRWFVELYLAGLDIVGHYDVTLGLVRQDRSAGGLTQYDAGNFFVDKFRGLLFQLLNRFL